MKRIARAIGLAGIQDPHRPSNQYLTAAMAGILRGFRALKKACSIPLVPAVSRQQVRVGPCIGFRTCIVSTSRRYSSRPQAVRTCQMMHH